MHGYWVKRALDIIQKTRFYDLQFPMFMIESVVYRISELWESASYTPLLLKQREDAHFSIWKS